MAITNNLLQPPSSIDVPASLPNQRQPGEVQEQDEILADLQSRPWRIHGKEYSWDELDDASQNELYLRERYRVLGEDGGDFKTGVSGAWDSGINRVKAGLTETWGDVQEQIGDTEDAQAARDYAAGVRQQEQDTPMLSSRNFGGKLVEGLVGSVPELGLWGLATAAAPIVGPGSYAVPIAASAAINYGDNIGYQRDRNPDGNVDRMEAVQYVATQATMDAATLKLGGLANRMARSIPAGKGYSVAQRYLAQTSAHTGLDAVSSAASQINYNMAFDRPLNEGITDSMLMGTATSGIFNAAGIRGDVKSIREGVRSNVYANRDNVIKDIKKEKGSSYNPTEQEINERTESYYSMADNYDNAVAQVKAEKGQDYKPTKAEVEAILKQQHANALGTTVDKLDAGTKARAGGMFKPNKRTAEVQGIVDKFSTPEAFGGNVGETIRQKRENNNTVDWVKPENDLFKAMDSTEEGSIAHNAYLAKAGEEMGLVADTAIKAKAGLGSTTEHGTDLTQGAEAVANVAGDFIGKGIAQRIPLVNRILPKEAQTNNYKQLFVAMAKALDFDSEKSITEKKFIDTLLRKGDADIEDLRPYFGLNEVGQTSTELTDALRNVYKVLDVANLYKKTWQGHGKLTQEAINEALNSPKTYLKAGAAMVAGVPVVAAGTIAGNIAGKVIQGRTKSAIESINVDNLTPVMDEAYQQKVDRVLNTSQETRAKADYKDFVDEQYFKAKVAVKRFFEGEEGAGEGTGPKGPKGPIDSDSSFGALDSLVRQSDASKPTTQSRDEVLSILDGAIEEGQNLMFMDHVQGNDKLVDSLYKNLKILNNYRMKFGAEEIAITPKETGNALVDSFETFEQKLEGLHGTDLEKRILQAVKSGRGVDRRALRGEFKEAYDEFEQIASLVVERGGNAYVGEVDADTDSIVPTDVKLTKELYNRMKKRRAWFRNLGKTLGVNLPGVGKPTQTKRPGVSETTGVPGSTSIDESIPAAGSMRNVPPTDEPTAKDKARRQGQQTQTQEQVKPKAPEVDETYVPDEDVVEEIGSKPKTEPKVKKQTETMAKAGAGSVGNAKNRKTAKAKETAQEAEAKAEEKPKRQSAIKVKDTWDSKADANVSVIIQEVDNKRGALNPTVKFSITDGHTGEVEYYTLPVSEFRDRYVKRGKKASTSSVEGAQATQTNKTSKRTASQEGPVEGSTEAPIGTPEGVPSGKVRTSSSDPDLNEHQSNGIQGFEDAQEAMDIIGEQFRSVNPYTRSDPKTMKAGRYGSLQATKTHFQDNKPIDIVWEDLKPLFHATMEDIKTAIKYNDAKAINSYSVMLNHIEKTFGLPLWDILEEYNVSQGSPMKLDKGDNLPTEESLVIINELLKSTRSKHMYDSEGGTSKEKSYIKTLKAHGWEDSAIQNLRDNDLERLTLEARRLDLQDQGFNPDELEKMTSADMGKELERLKGVSTDETFEDTDAARQADFEETVEAASGEDDAYARIKARQERLDKLEAERAAGARRESGATIVEYIDELDSAIKDGEIEQVNQNLNYIRDNLFKLSGSEVKRTLDSLREMYNSKALSDPAIRAEVQEVYDAAEKRYAVYTDLIRRGKVEPEDVQPEVELDATANTVLNDEKKLNEIDPTGKLANKVKRHKRKIMGLKTDLTKDLVAHIQELKAKQQGKAAEDDYAKHLINKPGTMKKWYKVLDDVVNDKTTPKQRQALLELAGQVMLNEGATNVSGTSSKKYVKAMKTLSDTLWEIDTMTNSILNTPYVLELSKQQHEARYNKGSKEKIAFKKPEMNLPVYLPKHDANIAKLYNAKVDRKATKQAQRDADAVGKEWDGKDVYVPLKDVPVFKDITIADKDDLKSIIDYTISLFPARTQKESQDATTPVNVYKRAVISALNGLEKNGTIPPNTEAVLNNLTNRFLRGTDTVSWLKQYDTNIKSGAQRTQHHEPVKFPKRGGQKPSGYSKQEIEYGPAQVVPAEGASRKGALMESFAEQDMVKTDPEAAMTSASILRDTMDELGLFKTEKEFNANYKIEYSNKEKQNADTLTGTKGKVIPKGTYKEQRLRKEKEGLILNAMRDKFNRAKDALPVADKRKLAKTEAIVNELLSSDAYKNWTETTAQVPAFVSNDLYTRMRENVRVSTRAGESFAEDAHRGSAPNNTGLGGALADLYRNPQGEEIVDVKATLEGKGNKNYAYSSPALRGYADDLRELVENSGILEVGIDNSTKLYDAETIKANAREALDEPQIRKLIEETGFRKPKQKGKARETIAEAVERFRAEGHVPMEPVRDTITRLRSEEIQSAEYKPIADTKKARSEKTQALKEEIKNLILKDKSLKEKEAIELATALLNALGLRSKMEKGIKEEEAQRTKLPTEAETKAAKKAMAGSRNVRKYEVKDNEPYNSVVDALIRTMATEKAIATMPKRTGELDLETGRVSRRKVNAPITKVKGTTVPLAKRETKIMADKLERSMAEPSTVVGPKFQRAKPADVVIQPDNAKFRIGALSALAAEEAKPKAKVKPKAKDKK